MTVWFASGNTHKKKELAAILNAAGSGYAAVHAAANAARFLSPFNLKIPADVNLVFNPEENGTSFSENALLKAAELYKLLNRNGCFTPGDAIIADDSGLCVDALGGRPGIYSARYSGPPGSEIKTGLSDLDRNLMLLSELSGEPKRSARFICAMVLLISTDTFYIAQETFDGLIVDGPDKIRGARGFGYDPILFIPEFDRTVAELSDTEKNNASHRGKAGRVIAKILLSW